LEDIENTKHKQNSGSRALDKVLELGAKGPFEYQALVFETFLTINESTFYLFINKI